MKSKRTFFIIGSIFTFLCLILLALSVFVYLYVQDQPPNRLSDSGYYIRRTRVFYYPGFGLSEPFEIEGADVNTFEILDELGRYAKDKRHAYFQGMIIPGADPQSFYLLNANYTCSADASHVYHRENVIPNFDPQIIPTNAIVTYCSPDEILFTP